MPPCMLTFMIQGSIILLMAESNRFYKIFADYYDDIFPLGPAMVEGILRMCQPLSPKTHLDLGCGTGSLALALKKHGLQSTGIDLSPELLKKARVKKGKARRPTFIEADMTKLPKAIKDQTFDLITCLGNTLVHLKKSQVEGFLQDIYGLLTANGRLILQIINYDLVLDEPRRSLPVIESDHFIFKRSYLHMTEDELTFLVELSLKNEPLEKLPSPRQLPLYPQRTYALCELLLAAGFNNLKLFSNYNGAGYDPRQLPLILVAEH